MTRKVSIQIVEAVGLIGLLRFIDSVFINCNGPTFAEMWHLKLGMSLRQSYIISITRGMIDEYALLWEFLILNYIKLPRSWSQA